MNAITAVPGIKVGHYTDATGGTGCTVVLCEGGAIGGVAVRGAAPGTRETDLMRPGNLVQQVHAILLTGGSAFGLDAASGVVRYLEERGIGFPTAYAKVPIVAAAVLFDLGIGDSKARPTAECGYAACLAASADAIAEGCVGAGTGATVGKAGGRERCTKGGIGTAAVQLDEAKLGQVGAIVAVNAFGEIVNPRTGRIVAGVRGDGEFIPTLEVIRSGRPHHTAFGENTALAVVAVSACLTKEQANRLAEMAAAGLASAIRPAHSLFDGDVVFALATGKGEPVSDLDMVALGAVAAEVVAHATLRAVEQATTLHGIPAARDLKWSADAH